jgi:hypothetical protein
LLLFLFSAVQNRSFSLLLFIANNHITNILQVIKKFFSTDCNLFPFLHPIMKKRKTTQRFF